MAKDTFSRIKPGWSLTNSMMSSWMETARDIPEFTDKALLEQMTWTKGKLIPILPTVDADNSDDNGDDTFRIVMNWNYDENSLSQNGNDEIWLIFYNNTTKAINCVNTGATRSAGTVTYFLPYPAAGETHVCFFAASTDGKLVSTETAQILVTWEANYQAL